MSLKANLTSADLTELRETVLGAADPLGVAAELSSAAEDGKLADPEDAGLALTLAAEIAESRNKLEAALRYVDKALESYGKRDDAQVSAARAVRARLLFRAGREDEATAELEPLRPLLTKEPDAAAYVSAALAVGGRHRIAEQWLTEAVKEALAERGAGEPSDAEDAGTLFFLLQQRHRIRHAIGLSHDAHDNLAERLETRLTNASTATTAASATGDLVFWPQADFEALPADEAEKNGGTWDGHRARLERELVRRAGAGQTDLVIKRHGGGQISWPPERNGACWCGSGLKYKKCCLPRSRG
ncbi:tetratricopeptide (TPR) repeat protein [Actinoplanes lutulentus]|uniref:SEC-C motif-containing protein n=1 Tax=Actinoplanes lutulentus TaxID=1287878 RepID=A0A327Z518_9ACTN|nr:SEC-C domain-containing protein [Actinoplanes lutulentus]MBB2947826.1 tetratricopeptide (TPR) repeat protein [Actinoplanes lutulentus]RAK29860.1 SEC-C motif-containing protein [Actinoplanes lutulentus]